MGGPPLIDFLVAGFIKKSHEKNNQNLPHLNDNDNYTGGFNLNIAV